MKRGILAAALGLMTLSHVAMARNGNGNGGGDTDLIARGTQTWFAVESAEHTIRGMVLGGSLAEADLTRLSVELNTTASATVSLDAATGTTAAQCLMFDESSRHGTVVKKEVRCGNFQEPRLTLTRGSSAWAVVEGLEKSLRMGLAADASWIDDVTAVESVLDGDVDVLVTVSMKTGSQQHYTCSRLYYNQPSATELNCARSN